MLNEFNRYSSASIAQFFNRVSISLPLFPTKILLTVSHDRPASYNSLREGYAHRLPFPCDVEANVTPALKFSNALHLILVSGLSHRTTCWPVYCLGVSVPSPTEQGLDVKLTSFGASIELDARGVAAEVFTVDR